MGKTTYSYGGSKWKAKTRFKGRFYGVFALGDNNIEDKYRSLKSKALEATEKNPMTSGQVKYREQRDITLYLLRKLSKMTYQEMSNMLGQYDLEMSYVQVRNICAKFGDTEKEKIRIVEKIVEKGVEPTKTNLKEPDTSEKGDLEEDMDDFGDI